MLKWVISVLIVGTLLAKEGLRKYTQHKLKQPDDVIIPREIDLIVATAEGWLAQQVIILSILAFLLLSLLAATIYEKHLGSRIKKLWK